MKRKSLLKTSKNYNLDDSGNSVAIFLLELIIIKLFSFLELISKCNIVHPSSMHGEKNLLMMILISQLTLRKKIEKMIQGDEWHDD